MTNKLQKSLHKMYETSYTNICQTENLSSNPLSHFQLYIESKSKYIYKSGYNNNANFIKIKGNTRYLKFSLSINIFTKEDKRDLRNNSHKKGIISLYERGSMNRTSLEVYIDGEKLPDDVCYVTIYNGSLDLYIPESFCKDNVFMDIITKKFTNSDKFSNIIIRNVTGNAVDFTLLNSNEIDLDSIKIFKNGLLATRKLDYDIINLGVANKFKCIFGIKIVNSDVLEIQIDPNCILYEYEIEKDNSLIKVPKNIVPNLPISLDICRFFVGGKRIFNRDIDIIAPRNFKIKNFEDKSKVLFFINYNEDYLKIDSNYHDDGMKAVGILNDEELVDIFVNNGQPDEGLEWVTDLNYPPRPININPNPNLLRDREFDEFVDDTVKEFLQDNAHNIIPLLSEYKNEYHHSFTFKINGLKIRRNTTDEMGNFDIQRFSEAKYVMSIDKKYDSYRILAFVDNVKIDEDCILIREFNNFIFLYISKKMIENNDTISISLLPCTNIRQYHEKMIITEQENQFFEIDRSKLGIIKNENDIIVVKKTDIGYSVQKNDVDYRINFSNKIEIEFINKKLLDEYEVYNSSFFRRERIKVTEKDKIIYKMEGLPSYSNYTIEVYNNGKLLIDNIDYFISNPKTIPGMEEELLVFRNIPDVNDELEIYHIEIPDVRFGTCQIVNSKKYDIVYFRTDRKFGFSKNYIDLYINDVLVEPENIREVALNLVAVEQDNIPRPYKYVAVKSKFGEDIFDIFNYIDFHNENPSKFAIYIDKIMNTRKINIDKIDKIIESLYPDVIQIPTDVEDTLVYRDLIDPLLNEISIRLRLGLMERRIDANKYLELFKQIDIVKYMDYVQRISEEVSINANENYLLKGININPTETLIPVEELTYILAKEIRDNKFPYTINNVDMTEEEYYTHPISNKLYLEEIRFASCNINIPETIIIDANAIEEEYFLEDKTRIIENKKIKKIVNPDFIENGEGVQFYNRIFVSKLLIQEFVGLFINGKNYTSHAIYNEDLKTIDLLIDIKSVDKVEIKYKQKVYSE